jgi:diguanylate cyclase (GGDEF)-like protein/PAS domain S-box-containing protein
LSAPGVDDDARLAAVRELAILDVPPQPALDRLARLAARLLRAPTALVSLVDADRQLFAACTGLGEPWATARQTPLSHSFCQYVVRAAGPLVVEDARAHPLVCDNPAVADFGVVAYAGMPLVAAGGEVLGSFCVVDGRPRVWSADDLATLEELARSASAELELRRVSARLAARTAELEARTRDLAGLLDATGELVCTVGPDGRITFVNRAWCAALGYAAEEAAALRPVDLVAPEHRARYVETARRLVGGERVDDFEAVLLARDGRRVVCRGRAVPVMEEGPDGPRCVGTRALYRDVTPEHETAARRTRLLAMLEVTSDFVGTVGPDGRVEYLNAAGRRLLGLGAAVDVAALRGVDFHPPATQALLRDDALPAAARDGRWEGEGALLGAGGEEIPVSMVVVAHPALSPGEPPHFSAVMRDRRERARAEAALERERAFLAATLESMSDGVAACDAEGRLALFNQAARDFHGLPEDATLAPEEWADRYDLFRSDGTTPLPLAEIPLRRAFLGEDVRDAELVIAPAGAEPRLLRASGRPIWDAAGATMGAVVAMRDVTERARTTAALRASELRLQAALDGGRVGFLALRPVRDAAGAVADFDVVAANAQAAALYGMTEEDFVDQRLGELFPVSRANGHLARYAEVLATGRPADYEFRSTDPRAVARWVRVQAVPLADAAGRPDGVALMFRDVSAERQAQEELRLLVEVSHALTGAPDVATAAEASLRLMGEAVGFEYGEAWLTAPDGVLRHGPVWHAPGDARLAAFARASDDFTFARGEGLPGQAWALGAPFVVPDLHDADIVVPRLAPARAAGVRAGAAVPVLAGGEVVAVLCFHSRRAGAPEASRVALLAAVAAQVGEVVRARLAEEARRESEARLSLIYESTSDLMFLMRVERDAAGAVSEYRCESVNSAYLEMTGLARDQVVGRTVGEILPPDGAAFVLAKYGQAVRTGDVLRYEETASLPTGPLTVETSLTPVLDDAGTCTHLLGAARDVSRQRQMAAELRESEARFRGVLENLRVAAVTLDAHGRVTFANDALLEATGWARDEVDGCDWFARFTAEPARMRELFGRVLREELSVAHYENEVVTRGGGRRLYAWDNTLLRDGAGAVVGTASVGRDVTEQRALEQRLAALSEHDELTGLLNRRGFRRLAEHTLRGAARTGRCDAVLCVDLDHFKPVNDTYGHAEGDRALQSVAEVLRHTVRDADFTARVGGDEFAVYVVGLQPGEGEVVAARLRANLEAHNAEAATAGRPYHLAFTVGVAELGAGETLDELLARGDAALYALKGERAR